MVVSKVKWWYPVPPCIIRVMDDHDSVLKMGQYMSNNTWHVKKDPLFRLKRLNALNGPQDVSIPYFVHLYPMFLGCFSCERGKGLPASLLGHLTNRIQPPPLEGLLFLACDWATCCWHVAHARLCSTGGSGCGGGLIMCLTTLRQGPRNLLPFLTMLRDVRKKKWMSQWRIALETWKAALEDQNWLTAQAKPTFLNLSHTPANRNGYPCCKHFWTSPTNTSFLPLSLENLNFKFVTVTRAASQPVASGFSKFRGCRIQDSHAQWFYVILIYARPLIHRMYIYVFICICLYIYIYMCVWDYVYDKSHINTFTFK